MAITKERLEELIKNEYSIYMLAPWDWDDIQEIVLKKNYYIDFDAGSYELCSGSGEHISKLSCLFEFKHDAVFYSKYVGIKKTIMMPTPPTYKEFLKTKIFSINNLGGIIYDKDRNIIFSYGRKLSEIEKSDFINTEENYYDALDRLVELWREYL